MFLYGFFIIGINLSVILINLILNSTQARFSNFAIIFVPILATISVLAIDLLLSTLIRNLLPNKWFSYNVACFHVSKKETKFYDKLFIKHWKNKILELGCLTSFSKRSVAKPDDREYLERFILECNYGEVIHIVNLFDCLLLFVIFPTKYALGFILPLIIVHQILHLMPFMTLRYNCQRLMRLRDIAEKKEIRHVESSNR